MVERWSSKPYAWVRFLLPLTLMKLNQFNSPRQNVSNNYFNLRKFKKQSTYNSFFQKLVSTKQTVYFKRGQSTLNAALTVPKLHQMFAKRLLLPGFNLNLWATSWKLFGNTTPLSYASFLQPQKQTFTPIFVKLLATNSPNTTENINHVLKIASYPLYRPLATWDEAFWQKKISNTAKSEYYFSLRTKRIQKTLTVLQKQFKLRQFFFRQSLEITPLRTPTPYLPISSQHTAQTSNLGIFKTSQSKQFFKQKLFYNLFSNRTCLTALLWKYFALTSINSLSMPKDLNNMSGPSTNLLPQTQLTWKQILKKNQSTLNSRIQSNFLVWYNFLLVRFLENCTGYKISIIFNPHLAKSLTIKEQTQLLLWEQRIQGFQRLIGAKISLRESLEVTYLSLKLKEPSLFSNWLSRTIRKVSFWKYRAFFRFLKFLFVNLFLPLFDQLGVNGVKLRLKGKVSVAGNARTRAIAYRIGRTSHSRIQNKILHELSFVYTFTGVLGLQVWYYF